MGGEGTRPTRARQPSSFSNMRVDVGQANTDLSKLTGTPKTRVGDYDVPVVAAA
jgi:hypothetical protein